MERRKRKHVAGKLAAVLTSIALAFTCIPATTANAVGSETDDLYPVIQQQTDQATEMEDSTTDIGTPNEETGVDDSQKVDDSTGNQETEDQQEGNKPDTDDQESTDPTDMDQKDDMNNDENSEADGQETDEQDSNDQEADEQESEEQKDDEQAEEPEELQQAEQEIVFIRDNNESGKAKKAKAKTVAADLSVDVNSTATWYTTPNLVFKCNYCSKVLATAYMEQYGDCYGGADDSTVVRAIKQDYYGSKQIYTVFRGLKGGITNYTITGDAYISHHGSAYCSNCGVTWGTDAEGWRTFVDNFTIAVYDRFELHCDANGGTGGGTLAERAAQEYYTFSNVPAPTKEGCEFLGWATSPNATTADADLTVGPSPNATSKTIYAVWNEAKKPEAPKKEDLYGILKNFVNVHCVNTKANHPDKQYSTVSGSNDDVAISEVEYVEAEKAYKCTVTVNGTAYAGFYGYDPSFGTGVKHTLNDTEEQYKTIVLKWDASASKWKPAGVASVSFDVTCCKHTNVSYNDNEDGKTHDGVCDDCHNTVVDDEAHEYNKDGVCDKCNAKCPHTDVTYDPNGDGKTHDGTCDNCHNVVVDDEAHEYKDGVCVKCGAKEPEQPKKEAVYTVTRKSGENVLTVVTRSAIVGTTVSAIDADKVYAGYTFDADNAKNVLSMEVKEDGTTELILYFDKDKEPEEPKKEAVYTVIRKSGENVLTVVTRSAIVGTTAVATDADKTYAGYTFDADNAKNVLSMEVKEDGTTELVLYFDKDKDKEPEKPDKPVNPSPNPGPSVGPTPNPGPVNPNPVNPTPTPRPVTPGAIVVPGRPELPRPGVEDMPEIDHRRPENNDNDMDSVLEPIDSKDDDGMKAITDDDTDGKSKDEIDKDSKDKNRTKDIPKTGEEDWRTVAGVGVLLLAAAAGLMAVFFFKKRKRDDD